MQIRETTGFARPFSAHPSQKNPGIRQVFPDFSISSGRKMPRAKLRSTANREIFVSGEAPGAGILDMYSEHRQRCLARKDPVCGCRIPNLRALIGQRFFAWKFPLLAEQIATNRCSCCSDMVELRCCKYPPLRNPLVINTSPNLSAKSTKTNQATVKPDLHFRLFRDLTDVLPAHILLSVKTANPLNSRFIWIFST